MVTGLKLAPSSAGLPGFRRGMIFPIFHLDGIMESFTLLLQMEVKYVIPLGPRCFIMINERPSGPIALEFLDFVIALRVCSGVKAIF